MTPTPAAPPRVLFCTYYGNVVHTNWRIPPRDVALHLALNLRFGGSLRSSYSVAHHTLAVSEILRDDGASPIEQMIGLTHDAHEARFLDVPGPVLALYDNEAPQEHARFTLWNAWGLPSLPLAAGWAPARDGGITLPCASIQLAWLESPAHESTSRVDQRIRVAEAVLFGHANLAALMVAKYGEPVEHHAAVVTRTHARHPKPAAFELYRQDWPERPVVAVAERWLARYVALREELGLVAHDPERATPERT